jgi:hypothetical protein
MKILSIDVGIKNLAFCLFEEIVEGTSKFKITKWDIVNISEQNETYKCTTIDKKGPCNKPAKFEKNNQCFCLKHSKKQPFIIPTKEHTPAYINKQKIQKLNEIADKHHITYDKSIKKNDLVTLINTYIYNNCFAEIKATNASKIDLITIGNNIKTKFDLLFNNEGVINYVVIENQISPIANRMKTIQGMIAQYFIMCHHKATNIQFVSASNKLKCVNTSDVKTKYSERKKLGITKCLEVITNEPSYNDKIEYFNSHKKKDDLSDSFLQGLWFFSTLEKK